MSDIMMRILPFYGLYLLPLLLLAALSWLGCLGVIVHGFVKRKHSSWIRLGLLLPSPATYMLGSFVYALFLRGHGTEIHKFMYELPMYLRGG